MGKVLRVDVDNPTENASYSIPSDNPFLSPLPSGVIPRPEIFAYGFRNPWRCDIDTGDPITGVYLIETFISEHLTASKYVNFR